jgi:3-oxoacyl-(acyl-carrier-protein) synthase
MAPPKLRWWLQPCTLPVSIATAAISHRVPKRIMLILIAPLQYHVPRHWLAALPKPPPHPRSTHMLIHGAEACPEAITYVAIHGTGTPLGDPIEMGALGQALSRKQTNGNGARHALPIGSVKSCYGHTEGNAGLTGMLLAIQALSNQVDPHDDLSDWGCRGSERRGLTGWRGDGGGMGELHCN